MFIKVFFVVWFFVFFFLVGGGGGGGGAGGSRDRGYGFCVLCAGADYLLSAMYNIKYKQQIAERSKVRARETPFLGTWQPGFVLGLS